MMKTKDILAMALLPALGVLTACSNDDAQNADRVPITLTGTTLTVEETRAAAGSDLNDGYIEAGQTVKVLVRNTNSTGSWAEYAYVAAANGVLTPPATPPYYPLDNTNVDIVAYSPSTASSTFAVLTDQTTNDSYMASDLVYASATNKAKSTTAVPLQFEHKMAKIVVNVTAGDGVGVIQSVRLASVYTQVPFDPSTGVIGSATGSQTPITIVNNNTTATASGAAVIPGQTVVGDLLTVVTNIGTATYAVESKTFTAGNVYILNIRVGRTSIGATTSITNWTGSGTVNVWPSDDTARTFMVKDDIGSYTFTMIKVEGGPFTTYGGKTVSGEVSDFYIGQLEVCWGFWWVVMHTIPSLSVESHRASSTYPVMGMSYSDIVGSNGFLEKLNAQLADQTDGMTFKLPTDIQWEYAARGGKNRENYLYSGGDDPSMVVNYIVTQGKAGFPVPCATKYANSLGISDMSGNAWEWVSDRYWSVTPGMVIPKDYEGPTGVAATGRLLRGGGWNVTLTDTSDDVDDRVPFLRVYARFNWGDNAHEAVGFRLVLQ
jgi:formylglycine-generating enzyme required for sulfatase activity